VLIIGGMANTFLNAQGVAVGKSLCEHDLADTAREIMAKAKGVEVVLPVDVVAKEFKAGAACRTVGTDAVEADDMILDVGPASAKAITSVKVVEIRGRSAVAIGQAAWGGTSEGGLGAASPSISGGASSAIASSCM
jgi:3-phosphoglycerate kinase